MTIKKDWCSYSPDVIFGIDISRACELHDYGYWDLYKTPKTKESVKKRKEIDLIFKDNLYKITNSHLVAWVYYIAVRLFGGIGLWKNDN